MRLLPMLACALSLVALEAAQAQSQGSIWQFFQRRPRQEATPPPAPPPAPPRPKPPATPRAKLLTPPAPPPVVVAPPKPAEPPPYEKDMQRLSEILGALHFLRPLCGAEDGSLWKDKMADLMDAEGGPQDTKERLAGAFNTGYNGFQLTYRTCTPSAILAVERYLAEGAKLSRDIATRHGN